MKMKLSVNEMATYEFTHRMAGHHCSNEGINKTLDAVVKHKRIRYVVKSKGDVIIDTPGLGAAVTAFNNE